VERIKEVPVLGPVINIFDTYPRISAWVILSAGIIILLLIEARDVGLTVGNWIALIIVSIIVAGLSIWIVSWEDEAGAEAVVVKSKSTADDSASIAAVEADGSNDEDDDSDDDSSHDDDSDSASDDAGSDDGGGGDD
jgi:hypothetical protein